MEVLRGRGYFLGGLLPRWFGEDGLMMLSMPHEPHWQGINLEFQRAKDLVSLVRQDWQQVRAGR